MVLFISDIDARPTNGVRFQALLLHFIFVFLAVCGAEFKVTQRYKSVVVAPKHLDFFLYFIFPLIPEIISNVHKRAIHMYTQAVQIDESNRS